MKPTFCLTLVLACLCLLLGAPAAAQDSQPVGKFVPVRIYDPSRSAEQDLQAAQAEAKRTGKNVLVEVGGKWCIWCRILDTFFQQHSDLEQLREKEFVTVAVNFSPENENKALLSRYPKIPGYPHLFVLDADGKLLQSQDTSELEQGRGYNLDKFRAFLVKWSPQNGGTAPDSSSAQ